MNKLVLKAGVPAEVGITGRNFRIFSASDEVQIEFYGSHEQSEWSLNTPLAAGIGLNFQNRPSPFTKITVVSEVDQTLEYWAGLDVADDDRLSGSLDYSGSVSVLTTLPRYSDYQAIKAVPVGSDVLEFRPSRRSATVIVPSKPYTTILSNGYVVGANESVTFEWNSQQELKNVSTGQRGFEVWETYD